MCVCVCVCVGKENWPIVGLQGRLDARIKVGNHWPQEQTENWEGYLIEICGYLYETLQD